MKSSIIIAAMIAVVTSYTSAATLDHEHSGFKLTKRTRSQSSRNEQVISNGQVVGSDQVFVDSNGQQVLVDSNGQQFIVDSTGQQVFIDSNGTPVGFSDFNNQFSTHVNNFNTWFQQGHSICQPFVVSQGFRRDNFGQFQQFNNDFNQRGFRQFQTFYNDFSQFQQQHFFVNRFNPFTHQHFNQFSHGINQFNQWMNGFFQFQNQFNQGFRQCDSNRFNQFNQGFNNYVTQFNVWRNDFNTFHQGFIQNGQTFVPC